MINGLSINNNEINFAEIQKNEEGKDTTTSFHNKFTTKYAFKSELGQIFNFNTSAHSCSGETQDYGNIMLNANPNDIPDIGVIQYQSPLKNGGILQNRRFESQELLFSLEVLSDSIENLEKEIQTMKQVFNTKGKLLKKYNGSISYLDVHLKDFTVGQLAKSGTQVEVIFESLSPFWINEDVGAIYFEGQTQPLNTSIVVSDSDTTTSYKAILQILGVSGNVNSLTLSINSYDIELKEDISVGDIIAFDMKQLEVFINGETKKYLGTFNEVPISEPVPVKITSATGSITQYNFYILYDKIVL